MKIGAETKARPFIKCKSVLAVSFTYLASIARPKLLSP